MSDVEKPKEKDKESQTDVSRHVQTVSLDKLIKRPESSSITINFYSPNYTLKTDKPVQTDTFNGGRLSKSSICSSTKSRKLASESREIRSFEYSQSTHKKVNTPPHETRQNKFMNPRKFAESKPNPRAITDLERKKLEVELKATEEIARIQQAVIEKRLALELASLQDGTDFHHKNASQQPGAHEDMRALEELTRKQNLLEYSLTHLDSADNSCRSHPPRPPQSTRVPLTDASKLSKTDNNFLAQNSTELNPLRQLIEKKINLDMGAPRTNDMKPSPPPTNHRDRYPPYPENRFGRMNPNMPSYPPPDQPGCSPYAMRRMRNRSLWKSAVIKIKKKIKHSSTPPPPWQ